MMNIADKKTSGLLNRVPEITIYFWVIKILATTIGETAADFLSVTLNMGLTITSYIMGALLVIALIMQFRAKRYVPTIYWISVVLISIVGTLITDQMVDGLGMSLEITTILFTIALIATFIAWYMSEKTLSIHSIFTAKRERFYWLAILFTFALGTASGDLLAEGLSLGYGQSAIIFGVGIAITTFLYRYFKLNAIIAFWIAYILTRPLGASIGDLLSQATADGGLGLGTVVTSGIFLVIIIGFIIYMGVQEKKKNQYQQI